MSEALSTRPSPRRGQERLQRRLGARAATAARALALVALGVEQELVERARLEDLALLGRRRLQQPRVDVARARRPRPGRAGARSSAASLTQLEVAHDRVGDVEVGVEAQLAEPRRRRARPGRAARRASSGTSSAASRRARTAPPRAPPTRRRPRRAPPRRTATAAAPRRGPSAAGTRARAARARASSRRAAAGASRRRARRACPAAARSLSSASGIGSIARRRAPGIRAACSPSTKTWSNSRPRGRVHRQHLHGARRGASATASSSRSPGLGHRGDVAGELARRGLRRAAHERRRRARRAARG